MNETSKLDDLRAEFVATSTRSLPVAGMIFWLIIGCLGLYVTTGILSYVVLFGSGMIFPLGILIDRCTGRRMRLANRANPVTVLFLQSLTLVILMWPMVIISAAIAHNADLIVLGAAILMGLIWFPYGWASNDPVGIQHAVGRCAFSYIAFIYCPPPYKATAISLVDCMAYLYSFLRMRKY